MTNEQKTKDMLGRSGLPLLHEALIILNDSLEGCSVCGLEDISLDQGLKRVLGQDITATEEIPPFPRSTMDGYAVRAKETFGASESLPAYLTVSGEVLMGVFPEQGPEPTACFKIATGGLLPPGTDAVVMFEHTVAMDETTLEVLRPVAPGDNVIGRGDDVAKQDLLLEKGHCLRPQDLGLLAGLGITTIRVRKKVQVGVFSTGDEVVPYTETPEPGKIRDMNSVTLLAMAAECDAEPHFYGVVSDDKQRFSELARKALAENDIVIFSGSSSVGSRDLGEKIAAELGDPGIILHGVAIKPGKPVIFSLAGDKAVFGLPGHPVSAAVGFELFVKPVIEHLSGMNKTSFSTRRSLDATCMRTMNSAGGRTDFIRVSIKELENGFHEAYPVLGKSSALSTMVAAQGFFVIEDSCQGIETGEQVKVYLY